MKKLFFLLVLCLNLSVAFSQAPYLFNYQAVVRDNTGAPVAAGTAVALTISIHSDSANGGIVYTEDISTTANQFGLVNVQIGNNADLTDVDWSGVTNFYMQVKAAIGGGAVTDMGTSQLVSVPFAFSSLFSKNSWNLLGNANTFSQYNFVGTTDNTPLSFRVNNKTAGHLDNTTTGYTSFGFGALANNTSTNSRSTAIGYEALNATTTGSDNTALGASSLSSNTTGSDNTSVGTLSLNVNTIGNNNSALGFGALNVNTTGNDNTSIGYNTLSENTTGVQNTALGSVSLLLNTTGTANTATGFQSLNANTTGSNNTATGWASMYVNTTGADNTALGVIASRDNTSGMRNTAIGAEALQENSTGSNNVAVGFATLDSNFTGTFNTMIGSGANVFGPAAAGVISNSCAIGANALAVQSNEMQFGNASVNAFSFGPTSDNFTGKALIVGSSTLNGDGAYLTTGGVWTSVSTREKKEDFTTLNKTDILSKIESMDIAKWKYIGTNEYHIGPVAEDFYEAFHVGINNKSISTMDPAGVALVAIQALNEKIEQLEKEIQALKAQSTTTTN